jgi:alpha-L-fucosidase 2
LSNRGEVLENIEYGRAGDFSLRMDAHIPNGVGPFPAAIIVHGGGWVRGDRRMGVEPLFKPLSDGGFAWFSISYRLVNDVTGSIARAFPTSLFLGGAVQDVRQAIAHVKAHARDYKTDPNRIVLIGESAGAQLASMAALKPDANGAVVAVVALYGPSDLVALAKTVRQIPDSLRRAVASTPWVGLLLAGLRNQSPINYVHKDIPPFLLIHGTADTLVPFDQSVQMCRKVLEAGAFCELYPVQGAGHGIRWWESVHLTAYKQHMIAWLEKQLQAQRRSMPASKS